MEISKSVMVINYLQLSTCIIDDGVPTSSWEYTKSPRFW